MGKAMDWRKARKFNGKEEKWDSGTVLDSGRVVFNQEDNSLAMRAKEAERVWLKEQRLNKRLRRRLRSITK